ncbi:MAG: PEP-utilizing enzyme [Actinomycetota bacterium]|nr:PEP-utilizing enzyme [Actinomycetota bacterium]
MTPLSADVWFWAMGKGIQAAARELRAPFGGFETATYGGGWAYEHELEPEWAPDNERLERAALEVADRWERELRPQSEVITNELRRVRPERPAPADAVTIFDRLLTLTLEQWRLHFLTVIPVHVARELVHDAYVEQLGEAGDLEPYRLIEGLPNETLAADQRLWEVAALARELDVADVILELPAHAALERLGQLHDGRRVLLALAQYLDRYGGRSRLHELSEPRAADRPDLALETVRLFLEQPRNLPAERRAKANERERFERATLARIADPAQRARFADLLARCVAAVPLEETHAYWIDYPGLAALREALLGFGRRLVVEARLDRPEDVFFLGRDEVRAAVVDSWGPGLQDVASARRHELEKARQRVPHPFLGPPPATGDVPAIAAKFYGVPGSARLEGDVLHGTPASRGSGTGTARVIKSREDFARVGAGDIVVCATTTPAWTPLFPSIAGLVTDTGGVLSHAAVVAREYSVPAVVGADVATTAIPDGVRVTVDGDAGTVTILRG